MASVNPKSEYRNSKQIRITKIQNSKPVYDLEEREFQTCFGHLILEFEIYL
jgi:hypothetical protein